MRRKRFLLLALAIVFLVGSGIFVSWYYIQNKTPRSASLEDITIAHPSHVGAGLIYVAQDKGFFSREGLHVNLLPFTAGKDALKAVIEGKADFGATAETPFVLEALRGANIYLLASMLSSEGDFEVIGRRDRGILSVADLEHKKIGVNKGTVGEFILDTFFVSHLLESTTIKKVSLNHEDMPNALAAGVVDAVITRYPHTVNTRKLLAEKASVFSTRGIYNDLFTITAGQNFVHTRKETVERLLSALITAEDFVKNHPDEAQGIIAKYANANKADLTSLWGNYDFHVKLDQTTLFVLEEEARWAGKHTVSAKMQGFNFLNLIYLDGLQKIRPESVTIIH